VQPFIQCPLYLYRELLAFLGKCQNKIVVPDCMNLSKISIPAVLTTGGQGTIEFYRDP